jgi:PqqD family protein of HPr-rel-A system
VSPRFVADPDAGRLILPLDGLSAIYHRASGTTHLLASPAPEILSVIAADPADVDGIAARLAERFDVAAEGGVAEVIADRLAELEAVGLVART